MRELSILECEKIGGGLDWSGVFVKSMLGGSVFMMFSLVLFAFADGVSTRGLMISSRVIGATCSLTFLVGAAAVTVGLYYNE